MSAPEPDVAQILRRFGDRYRQRYGGLSREQARVVTALTSCRTAALGGHVEACDACGHRQIAYNSCRNRHCPKCQAAATARWLERERTYLLPVPYSHVVFTLPHALAPLALQNPRVAYGILFRAACRTLLEIALDERHLGARIGFVAILHTWGQALLHHPHLHCLVPAGGLAPDGSRWISSRARFFLPVDVLGALFRGKYLALLKQAFEKGKLVFHGQLASLAEPAAFAALLRDVRQQKWVVYAKPPFGGPDLVLKYLARYTHRIAIANSRLVAVNDSTVTFTWKDYSQESRSGTMELSGCEFVRRFLLHALPKGFVRIRRYGILANAHREDCLARCRALLGMEIPGPEALTPNPDDRLETDPPAGSHSHCPACQTGNMRVIDWIPPEPCTAARAPPPTVVLS
jgi:hypothetical protein